VVGDARLFEIEPAPFHTTKQRFDLPAFAIGSYGIGTGFAGGHNQKFAVRQTQPGQIRIDPRMVLAASKTRASPALRLWNNRLACTRPPRLLGTLASFLMRM